MANILTLTVDNTETIVGAAVNGNDLGDVVSVSQSLSRGTLSAVITANFDEVVIEEAAPTPPGVITATFTGGATIALSITDPALAAGHKFAYKYVAAPGTLPTAPVLNEVIVGATDMSGNTASLNTGSIGDAYLLYELDSTNRVISYLGHLLVSGEEVTT